MHTAALVRRHINQLNENIPFSIRDFLNYGSRNAIDQIFYRLVKTDQIIRIARGLFIKNNCPVPSASTVALIKATAFNKKIAVHGAQAASQLKIIQSSVHGLLYACSGSSSSFRFGNIRIHYLSSSARKIVLGDDLVGLTVRALWHSGKQLCTHQTISQALINFNREDRCNLRQRINIMPSWLANYFTQ